MASIFDEERKALGLGGGGAISSPSQGSIFDGERMDFGLLEDTRPKTSKPTPAEQKQIMNEGRLKDNEQSMSPPSILKQQVKQPQLSAKSQQLPKLDTMQALKDFQANAPIPQKGINERLGEQLREVPVLGSIYKGLDKLQKFTEPAAKVAQEYYTPGAGLTALGAAERGAMNLVSRVAPKLPRLVNRGLAEGAIGAYAGAGQSLAANPEEGLTGAAKGAGIGGFGGAALPFVGKGVKMAADRTGLSSALSKLFARNGMSDDVAAKEVENILALPMGRKDAARLRKAPQGGVDGPIVNPYTFALPEPKAAQPVATSARIGQRANPYRDKYNQLIGLAHETKFTPGKELEELESLWSQIADREDPSLDELIKLAHPTYVNKVKPGLASEARSYQAARDVAGAPLPIKRTEQIPQGVIAEAAPITQKVGRRPEGMPFKAPVKQAAPKPAQELPKTPIKPVETAQPVAQPAPKAAPKLTNVPKFINTLEESPKPPQGFKEKLKAKYTPITNQETLNIANKRINKDTEEATSFVLGNSRFSAEKAAVAQRLIDHYNGQGNYQRAVDIAQKVSEEATKAGQSIQALSMFNRLTPEGVLIHAQRIATKTNEAIPLGAKEVKVTPQMASDITGLAQTAQKMTGVKDLSNDVINILDRAKAGEKLSETETQALKRFVNESKQFVEETTKKPRASRPPRQPQQPKDKRIRDNVVSFLEAQEKAAKERLRARGHRVSSTPLDIWADYAIIGATKMGKGSIKFADWSESMVKDLGEEVRPHLQALYERARETFEGATRKVTTQTISQAEKLTEKVIKSKQLSESEANSLRTLAQKVSKLSGEEKRIASQDLQAILQTLEKPGVLKKISTAQTIGQLLNPKTQVRNALGNELFYRLERLNKLVATPIDIVRSKITGGERTVTFRTHNQGEYWHNWMRGLKAGWDGVNVNGLETQYDLGSPAFKSKYNPLTYMEKALGAALKSFDTAAYMRAYNNTVGEMATLRAINEGKKGSKDLIQKYIREADENVMKIADEYGKYVTMQDNNLISKGLVMLKKGLNFKQDFGIGDLVLKYPKTPGALLMRALEYSPAGFVRSAVILSRPIFKKEANTAEVTQALSRAIIGSLGLSGMGYFLLDKGVITGSASKDRDIRDLQRSAGQGQYQVNISALVRLVRSGFDSEAAKLKENDFLYTYDWMQPVSIALSIGANVKKNMEEGKNKLSGLAGTAYNSFEGGVGTLTEQSVLGGLKRAAEGYPGQTITDKIMDILSDIPSSFVPTVLNQANQIMDNNKRETYSPNKLEQSLNKAAVKIPGLAQKLPQQYDTLGEPKQAYQDNNPANVLLSPGFGSRYKLSPEAKFVVDLINETGDQTLAPRAPGKSIRVDGQTIKLDGDMYSRYQKMLGEETRNRISKINPSGSLKTRISRTEKALDAAGDKVRGQLKKELTSK